MHAASVRCPRDGPWFVARHLPASDNPAWAGGLAKVKAPLRGSLGAPQPNLKF